MNRQDDKLNQMIGSSDIPLKKQQFWFDFNGQRYHAYNTALQLYCHFDDMSMEDAIDEAVKFNNIFYNKVIRKG